MRATHPTSAVRERGFTLLELLTLVATLTVATSIAIPSWRFLLADNRIAAASNGLVMSLQRARSEALKRNASVLLCRGNAADGCLDGADWGAGWLVVLDADADGRQSRGDLVIAESAEQPGTQIRASRPSALAFRYDGRSPGSNATWTVCDPNGVALTRHVILSNEGRIRTTREDDSSRCS